MELVSGKGGQGRIVLDGVTIKLVNVDNAVYINSGAGFYAASRAPQLRDGYRANG